MTAMADPITSASTRRCAADYVLRMRRMRFELWVWASRGESRSTLFRVARRLGHSMRPALYPTSHQGFSVLPAVDSGQRDQVTPPPLVTVLSRTAPIPSGGTPATERPPRNTLRPLEHEYRPRASFDPRETQRRLRRTSVKAHRERCKTLMRVFFGSLELIVCPRLKRR